MLWRNRSSSAIACAGPLLRGFGRQGLTGQLGQFNQADWRHGTPWHREDALGQARGHAVDLPPLAREARRQQRVVRDPGEACSRPGHRARCWPGAGRPEAPRPATRGSPLRHVTAPAQGLPSGVPPPAVRPVSWSSSGVAKTTWRPRIRPRLPEHGLQVAVTSSSPDFG